MLIQFLVLDIPLVIAVSLPSLRSPPFTGFSNASPQYLRLAGSLVHAELNTAYRYSCPVTQNQHFRELYGYLLANSVNDSFFDRQYVVGARSLWRSDCISFFNEYYFSKPNCPRLYGCGNPHITLLSHPTWITSLYMCQYYPSFSRLEFFLSNNLDYDLRAVLYPNLQYSVFVKQRLVLYSPSNASFALTLPSCRDHYFVYFYRGEFRYRNPDIVVYDHDVCVHHSDLRFLSSCLHITWYNASDFLQFVLLNLKYSNDTDDFYCRSKTEISFVDDRIASNCTREQLLTHPVEFGCVISSVPYPMQPDPAITCYSIHSNSYNWFTALFISFFGYFLDPIIESLKALFRALIGVACDMISQFVSTVTSYSYAYEIFLLFSPLNLYLYHYCRSWIFVLYVDISIFLLYMVVINI